MKREEKCVKRKARFFASFLNASKNENKNGKGDGRDP
jgi:hypothetical protein